MKKKPHTNEALNGVDAIEKSFLKNSFSNDLLSAEGLFYP